MKEDLLQYIWRQKLIPVKNLETVNGEALQILYAGRFNTDGGPDFLEAKIRIGDTILAGSVEIHVRSSDWKTHGHSSDKKYSNVILHVVYFHDEETLGIPTLEMNGKILPVLLQRYRQLMESGATLPCEPSWKEVDEITVASFKERLIVERMERKSGQILEMLQQKNNDWLLVIYRLLGRYFGGKVNAFAFEVLTEKLDYKILLKHADNIFQLEALLFGVSGLLQDQQDEYALRLKKEFDHLKKKYELSQLPAHYWNFLRIRPAAFPTMRLALFAQLIHRTPQFTKLAALKYAKQSLEQLRASGYWEEHYMFGRYSEKKVKQLGKSAVEMLLVNVCVPLQYTYAKNMGESQHMEEAIELLAGMPAEENRKTKNYTGLFTGDETAYDSQAFLELYDGYCTSRRCLHCRIGSKILQGNIRLHYQCSEPDPEHL